MTAAWATSETRNGPGVAASSARSGMARRHQPARERSSPSLSSMRASIRWSCTGCGEGATSPTACTAAAVRRQISSSSRQREQTARWVSTFSLSASARVPFAYQGRSSQILWCILPPCSSKCCMVSVS